MATREVYVSVDIECDGPIPGPHSMLSIGAAACTLDDGIVDTFTQNILPLEGATADPDTMAWWAKQGAEIWQAATQGAQPAKVVMSRFVSWVNSLEGKPVFVAYPAGYDFTFVYWYLIWFTGSSPFSFSAFDIKTAAAMLERCDYHKVSKRTLLKRWPSSTEHTHVALDDAIEQAELFLAIMRENRKT